MEYVITPGQSIATAMRSLKPGDILTLRGGTYKERVMNPSVAPGTATAPITIRNYPNEHAIIEGLFWLRRANWWIVDGLKVTWSTANTKSEHMVKLQDCTDIKLTNCEFWGAKSYAALLVAGTSARWRVEKSYIHDTYKSNDTNQDHLIYVNCAGPGTIERCLLINSPNGRGVKVGPSSSTTTPLGRVSIRYCTLVNNLGPSNIQLSYSATDCVVERCIMQKSSKECVTPYNLNGKGNVVKDCIGWQATAVMGKATGLTDGGGNKMLDPKFDEIYCTANPAAVGYGFWG